MERLCLDQASCKEGLAPLAPFKNLVSLSVQFAGLTALDTLPPLPNCNTLKLSDNKIKGGLDKLKDLPELEKLYLAANQIATLEALAPLAGLKKLAWVDLEGNPVNKVAGYRDSMFELLPNLVVLDGRNADGDDVDEQDEDDEDEDEDDEDDEGEEEGEGEDDDDEEEEEEEDDEGGAAGGGDDNDEDNEEEEEDGEGEEYTDYQNILGGDADYDDAGDDDADFVPQAEDPEDLDIPDEEEGDGLGIESVLGKRERTEGEDLPEP